VADAKIAAFGVRIKRGVTLHGFALNVQPNLRHWSFITPCGITNEGVTSMTLQLQRTPPMREVRERVAGHFESLFDVELVPSTLRELQEQVSRRIAPGDQEGIDHHTDLVQRSQTP
jgi:lipoic acid synthetase/lipoyl(octanoyl) transferase